MIDAQERFLKQFDESLRPHLLDYVARIESLDVDVVMFMARKAVCLFDAMSRLGLVRTERIWTSNRVLDLNTDWLQGRRIAVVDDTLFSGTSLWRTKQALHEKGLTDYSVHVFCASKKSWSPSMVMPLKPFLELDDAAMTGFCTAEVNAISLLPRPYTIDYPLLENVRLPAADVVDAIAVPGWRLIDNSSAQQIAHDVRSVTLEPEAAALEEFELRLGWPIGRHSQLIKLRLYSWRVNGGRPVHFGRLLPLVVLDPLTHGELDELWHVVTGLFRETGSQLRSDALPTRESRLRVVQYLLAFELGAVWLQHLEDCTGARVQRTVDARQLAYAFSPEVAQALTTLSLELPTRWLAPVRPPPPPPSDLVLLEPLESRYRGYDALGVQARLTEPFLDELWPKEVQARDLAKSMGPKVFSDPEYRKIMDRLNDGYSLPMLRARIQGLPAGLNPAAVVSRFIDVAIDRGVIVPITVDKDGEIYRAYRHGEDLLFTLSEKRLFCLMLSALLDESGVSTVPRIWAEKAIAIFIRAAFEAGYLHEWTIGAGERIGLRWTLHGIVTQVDPKPELYKVDHSLAVTGILRADRYLADGAGGKGLIVRDQPDANVGLMPKAEPFAKRVGRAIGAALGPGQPSEIRLTTKEITLIASCLRPPEMVMALAAELEIFRAGWPSVGERLRRVLSQDRTESRELLELAESIRRHVLWTALNSAHLKVRGFHHGEHWAALNRMKDQLPPVYADTWEELFPLEIQNEAAGATPKLKEAIGSEILLLERSRHLIELLLLGLYFGAGETEAVLEVDYSEGAADEQVWQLSPEELNRQRVGIRKARQWIDTSLSVRPYLTPDDITIFRKLHAGLPEGPTEQWDWRGVAKYAELHLAECSRQATTALDLAGAIAVHRGKSPGTISYRNVLFVSFTAGRNRRYVEQRIARAIREAARRARQAPDHYGRLVQIPVDEDIRLWGADIVLTSSGRFARASLVQAMQGIWTAVRGEAEFRFAFYVNVPDDEPLVTGSDPGPFHGRLFRQRLADLRRIKLIRELREGVLVIQAMGSGVNPSQVNEIIRAAGGEPAGKVDRLSSQPVERRFRIVSGSLPAVEPTFGAVRTQDRVNVGIITIVAHEAQAVRRVLEAGSGYDGEQEINGRFFEHGRLPAQEGVHRVVTTMASAQGNSAVMSAYEALMREFAPHLVVLVGIAGGIHADLEICDVAVADQVFYYDRRKITPKGVLRRLEGYRPEGRMRRLLIRYQNFRGDPATLESLDGTQFRVFVGPIASGEAVIADPNAEEKVYAEMVSNKCLAVEMEAAGLAQAIADDTRASALQASGYLVVRGISDLANTAKSDAHRVAASTNAMLFLKDFLSIIKPFAPEPGESSRK